MHKKRIGKRNYFYTTIRNKDKVKRIYLGNNYKKALLKESRLKNDNSFGIKHLFSFNLVLIIILICSTIFLINYLPSKFGITGFSMWANSTVNDFATGLYSQSFFNVSFIQLNVSDSLFFGNYTSIVFDSGGTSIWNNISWFEGAPYQEELLSNGVDELKYNYMNGTNMTGNVLLYHFNNLSSAGENDTYVYDYSGIGNNGSCLSRFCPVWSGGGKFGGGFNFNGTNHFDAENLNKTFDIKDNFTVSLWIKPQYRGNNPRWISLINSTNNFQGGIMGAGTSGNKTFLRFNSATLITTSQINYDVWRYVVFMIRAGQKEIYINGINQTLVSGGISANAQYQGIGGGYTSYEANGTIDEVAIWNRTLTNNEIFDIYKRGALRLNISVRSCDDALCDTETWSAGYENASYNSMSISNNRYFQYRVNMESNSSWLSPELYNISVGYSPTNPPTINSNYTFPEIPLIGKIFLVSVNISDVEGDVIPYLNFTIQSPNGSLLLINTNGTYSGTFASSTLWNSTSVTIHNESNYLGNWFYNYSLKDSGNHYVNGNGSFNINKNAPTANISIIPPIAYSNTTILNGTFVINDADEYPLTVTTEWLNNSVKYYTRIFIMGNGFNSTNLSTDVWYKGNNWTFNITISNGINNFYNETSINISNTRSTVPSLMSPSNNSYIPGNQSTILDIGTSTDIDGDILTYYFYVGTDDSTMTLAQSNTSDKHERGVETRGVRYYWKANSYDDWEHSSNTTISTYLVNKLPKNNTYILIYNEFESTSINTTDMINCTTNIINDDIGGDIIQKINSTLYIYNGTELYKTYERLNLDNNTFISWGLNDSLKGIQAINETWMCGVQLFDGIEYSNLTNSSILTIVDIVAPIINLIYPNNNTGDNDANITFSYNVTDDSNMANCSLIINSGINQTENLITKDTIQNFISNNLTIGFYNWSINCTDVYNNIGNSAEKRKISIVVTSEFSGRTTNLSNIGDISNVTNLVIENPEYGMINFTENINLSSGVDLNSTINISNNRIYLNSSIADLNKAARLTLYNLTYSNPEPLKDGIACSTCTEISYTSGTFIYDVTGFSVYSAGETPITVTTAATTGGGGGGGTSGGQLEIPLKIVPEEIKTKMVTVAIEKKNVKLQNDGDVPLKVDLSIKGLENIVELEETTLEIPPFSFKEIPLIIKAPEKAGVYSGELIANSKKGKKSSIILIEVESENPAFEVMLNIPDDYKQIYSQDELAFKVDIQNKGIISEGNTQLIYLIKDSLGNEVYREETSQLIKDKLSFVKKIKMSKLKAGTYVSVVELKYKDTTAVSSSTFKIKSEEEIVKENMNLNIILATSIIFLTIVLSLYNGMKRIVVRLRRKDLNKLKQGYKKGSLSKEAYKRLFKKR